LRHLVCQIDACVSILLSIQQVVQGKTESAAAVRLFLADREEQQPVMPQTVLGVAALHGFYIQS
jgi:hypothetical protein